MLYLFSFINKTYWKSILLPVMSFVFPMLFIAIVGGVYNIFGQITPTVILPAAWSIGIMVTTLLCLPQMVFEMKNSIILKRLGVSKYKPWMFYIVLIIFFILINFISYICLIATSYLVLINHVDYLNFMLTHSNIGEVIFALFMTFVMSLSIGLFLSSVCKSIVQIQIIGSIILLSSLILSGMVATIILTYGNLPYRVLTFLSPYTYTNSMLTEAWFWGDSQHNLLHSSIFEPGKVWMSGVLNSNSEANTMFTTWQKWMNLLIPPAISIVLLGYSFKTLTFNPR